MSETEKLNIAIEALSRIKKRAHELRHGTDDWFELVEFELCAGNALEKIIDERKPDPQSSSKIQE